MVYEARTIPEAVRKWQRDALTHISVLSLELGIPFERGNARWIESNNTVGSYGRGDRDRVEFKPYRAAKIKRTLGDARPRGTMTNELAIVDNVGPHDFDSEETLSWSRQTSRELSEVESATHGWSATVSLGFEAGTETNKVVGGIELGAFGEYSKERVEAKATSIEAGHSTKINLTAGEMARIIQTVRSGEVEIDVEDLIVLELGWRVADWKRTFKPYLHSHAGYAMARNSRGGGTRSRWHWDCLDADDLRTAFVGTNPRYPALTHPGHGWGAPFADWGGVRDSYRWLMDESHRTVRVKSKAIFKQGIWSDARAQRLNAAGEVIEDKNL